MLLLTNNNNNNHFIFLFYYFCAELKLYLFEDKIKLVVLYTTSSTVSKHLKKKKYLKVDLLVQVLSVVAKFKN